MRSAIDKYPERDYRRVFGFMLYYPIMKHKDYALEPIIEGLYSQGLVPLLIITDKRHEYFKLLHKGATSEIYKLTDTIIIPIGFNTQFIS